MKVLLVVHQFFPEHRTGTEVLTLELARGLRMRGHSVRVLTGDACATDPELIPPRQTLDEYDGFPVHRLRYGTSISRDPFALHACAPARVALVKELVSRMKPDIVHVNHFLGLSSRIFPEIRGLEIPVLYSATDFWSICPLYTLFRAFDKQVCGGPGDGLNCLRCCLYKKRPAWVARVAKRMAPTPMGIFLGSRRAKVTSLVQRPGNIARDVNSADMVISSTRFLADMLSRNGIDAERIRVIPYGVDIGSVPGKRAIPGRFTPDSPLRLGFIGTITEFKGPHIILDALELLGEKSRAVSLDLYGKIVPEDPYSQLVRRKVERIGGRASLRGTFQHERMGEILGGLHLLIVPSLWYESTPLVLCSSLGAGIPALVSRLGGMTEIIEEGANGLSFPAGNGEGLAKVLLSLLEEPGILADLHRTIRPRNRTASDYAEDIESAYTQILDRKTS